MHSQSHAIAPIGWHPVFRSGHIGSLASRRANLAATQAPLRVLAERCAQCPARAISVCGAVRDEGLARLAEAAVSGLVEGGRCFIEEGDPATDFFTITAGCARLYKLLPDGRRQITGFATTGHFLGLAARGTFAFSAEPIETVKFCRFSRERMHHLVNSFPALGRRLLELAANELVAATEQMLLLGRKSARERLASFLASRVPEIAEGSGKLARIHLPMSRGDIGDYLGLTLETVSRTFARLKAERLIAVPTANEIVVLNGRALKALATGESRDL